MREQYIYCKHLKVKRRYYLDEKRNDIKRKDIAGIEA